MFDHVKAFAAAGVMAALLAGAAAGEDAPEALGLAICDGAAPDRAGKGLEDGVASPAPDVAAAVSTDGAPQGLGDGAADGAADAPGAAIDETQALRRVAREVAAATADPRACRARLRAGERRFEKELARARRGVKSAAGYARADDEQVAAVQAELSDLWLRDQAARRAWLALREGDDPAATWARARAALEVQRVDREAARVVRRLLERIDWFGQARYGARTSNHAWLLVQHADHDPALQRLALERMAPYLERGDVKAANYAYLFDRVAVNAGRPQRYGTQPTWACTDGRLELEPIEDREAADRLRADLGMPPLGQALAEMSANACR